MSQDLERETTASTVWSLVGALSGLLTGFLFLSLAMGAVTYANSNVLRREADASANLIGALQADFVAQHPKSVAVSPDGKKLRLFVKRQDVGPPLKVIYLVNESKQGVMISRQVYHDKEVIREMAKLESFSFAGLDGKVVASWSEDGQPQKRVFAIDRWFVRTAK